MIKYINIPYKLIGFKMNPSSKLLYGALVVLTRKGTSPTTVSNLYFGKMLNKTSSQVSVILKDLKSRGFILVGRKLGRRTIELNTPKLKRVGLLTDLRPSKTKA